MLVTAPAADGAGMGCRSARRCSKEEHGFTIVEVMVAMVILLVALLALTELLNTGNRLTSVTLAREAGNNLAREITERSRQVSYASLTSQDAATQLRATFAPEATTAGAPGTWTMRRRNVNFTVAVTTCEVDDPSDGYGAVDNTFCSFDPAAGPPPGGGGSSGSLSLQLYGVPFSLAAGGNLFKAVCDLLGPNPALLTTLSATLSTGGADLRVCPGQNAPISFDTYPDDLKRVTATVSWTSQRAESVAQSALIPSPGGGAS